MTQEQKEMRAVLDTIRSDVARGDSTRLLLLSLTIVKNIGGLVRDIETMPLPEIRELMTLLHDDSTRNGDLKMHANIADIRGCLDVLEKAQTALLIHKAAIVVSRALEQASQGTNPA